MTSRIQGKLLAQRALFQRLQSSKRLSKLGQAGFTLIELLVAIVIVGILSAIAIPAFLQQSNRAATASLETTASSLARKCASAIAVGIQADYDTGTTVPTGITASCTATGATPSGSFAVTGGKTYSVNASGQVTSS